MGFKILVVDDEKFLRDTVQAYLEQDGFQVSTAVNGKEAMYKVRHEKPDLVILDVMMPEMNGWEAARIIRKESSVPIIFLTARVDETDQVAGLELGADDYVTKPFSPRALVARVRAVLRRVHGDLAAEPTVYRAAGLELDIEARTVKTEDGRQLRLTRSEFDLLATLMANPGRVFTRMELLDHIQGDAYAPYERTIDVHVKNLRAKFKETGLDPGIIETVYGVGYRLRNG